MADNKTDLGAKQVTDKFVEAAKKGHFGVAPDETPNEAYTVKGVTSGSVKTPESAF